MSAFNGLPFLSEAVDSLLQQSYTNFEILVVDDGSTDGTFDVLQAYAKADRRVRLLKNPVNIGHARSLNRGIGCSHGKFIARHDADDISMPGRFARQVEFLEAHPEVGLVGTLPEFIDESGASLPLGKYPLLTDNESIQRQMLDSNCIRHGSVMMRRTCLDAVGLYDPELEPSEDYDLWLRIGEVAELTNLPEASYLYRQHPNSESSRHFFVQMFNKAAALERAAGRRHGQQVPGDMRTLLGRDFLKAALVAVARDDLEGARQAVDRGGMYAPEMWNRGDMVESTVERFFACEEQEQPHRFLEVVFGSILPRTPHLRRARRLITSRLHMKEVFEGAAHGQDLRVARNLWPGLFYDPRWLMNRGVWAITVRRVGGRHLRRIRQAHPGWFSRTARRSAGASHGLPGGTTPPGS